MSDVKKISATVGQPLQIKLQSMAGSTGYAWYLTYLDGGLGLSSAIVVPTAPGIAPVNHIFDFLACTAGTFKVVFELRAPWRPDEPADTETFEVEIKPMAKSAKDEIEAAMGGREFVRAAVANVGAQLEPSHVLKYAAPMTQPIILYAAPVTWGAATRFDPGTLSAATMVAYAAPVGPSTMAVYGAQAADPCLQGRFAVQPMYAAPLPPYAAPMIQPYAAPWPYPQPLYAAPMTMMRYAAPYPSTPQGCC